MTDKLDITGKNEKFRYLWCEVSEREVMFEAKAKGYVQVKHNEGVECPCADDHKKTDPIMVGDWVLLKRPKTKAEKEQATRTKPE